MSCSQIISSARPPSTTSVRCVTRTVTFGAGAGGIGAARCRRRERARRAASEERAARRARRFGWCIGGLLGSGGRGDLERAGPTTRGDGVEIAWRTPSREGRRPWRRRSTTSAATRTHTSPRCGRGARSRGSTRSAAGSSRPATSPSTCCATRRRSRSTTRGSRRPGSSGRACCRPTAPSTSATARRTWRRSGRARSRRRSAPSSATEAARLVAALGDRAELRAELAGPLAAAVVAETLGLDGRDRRRGRPAARLVPRDRRLGRRASRPGTTPTAAGAAAMDALGASIAGHVTGARRRR